MKSAELQGRTKEFSLRVLNLIEKLPNTIGGRVLANQLTRSATSVSGNYRAACRARSRAEFASKLGTVAEEADESLHWLELIRDGGFYS
jgi:four helix bundle protein